MEYLGGFTYNLVEQVDTAREYLLPLTCSVLLLMQPCSLLALYYYYCNLVEHTRTLPSLPSSPQIIPNTSQACISGYHQQVAQFLQLTGEAKSKRDEGTKRKKIGMGLQIMAKVMTAGAAMTIVFCPPAAIAMTAAAAVWETVAGVESLKADNLETEAKQKEFERLMKSACIVH